MRVKARELFSINHKMMMGRRFVCFAQRGLLCIGGIISRVASSGVIPGIALLGAPSEAASRSVEQYRQYTQDMGGGQFIGRVADRTLGWLLD